MRRGPAAALLAVAELAATGSVAAHVTPTPTFVYSGQNTTITLVVPNEREVRMNGLSLTAPAGVELVAASASDQRWPGTVRGSTATWRGCCVPAGTVGNFVLELVASGKPRSVRLGARQLYPDGESVRWPVQLAVVPAPQEQGSLTTTLAVGALGLLVTVGVVVVAWLRRSRPEPEGPSAPTGP